MDLFHQETEAEPRKVNNPNHLFDILLILGFIFQICVDLKQSLRN